MRNIKFFSFLAIVMALVLAACATPGSNPGVGEDQSAQAQATQPATPGAQESVEVQVTRVVEATRIVQVTVPPVVQTQVVVATPDPSIVQAAAEKLIAASTPETVTEFVTITVPVTTVVDSTRLVVGNLAIESDMPETIAVSGTLFSMTRSQAQVPGDCPSVGMCNFKVDLPANGVNVLIGSPAKAYGETRLLDASKDEAQALVFINPTTETITIQMDAWSGANALFSMNAPAPVNEDVMLAAATNLMAEGMARLTLPGNCDVDGCQLDKLGYMVFVCMANDKCELKYSFNPAQDPSDKRYVPAHDEVIQALVEAKKRYDATITK